MLRFEERSNQTFFSFFVYIFFPLFLLSNKDRAPLFLKNSTNSVANTNNSHSLIYNFSSSLPQPHCNIYSVFSNEINV